MVLAAPLPSQCACPKAYYLPPSSLDINFQYILYSFLCNIFFSSVLSFHKSGAETKSDFVRARILGEHFKVITVDKSAVEYYRKLSELTAQIHKIGVLYNQAVRAINSYHSVKTAQILLEKLEQLSVQIIALQEQAISLTIDYRK